MKTLTIAGTRGQTHGSVDFFISGRPLWQQLEKFGYDLVPRLSSGLELMDQGLRTALLAETPGDTPSGRVGLYVCRICGDYWCGVVSARVRADGDDFVWSDFVYETNDPEEAPVSLGRIGPFRFAGDNYRTVVMGKRLDET